MSTTPNRSLTHHILPDKGAATALAQLLRLTQDGQTDGVPSHGLTVRIGDAQNDSPYMFLVRGGVEDWYEFGSDAIRTLGHITGNAHPNAIPNEDDDGVHIYEGESPLQFYIWRYSFSGGPETAESYRVYLFDQSVGRWVDCG